MRYHNRMDRVREVTPPEFTRNEPPAVVRERVRLAQAHKARELLSRSGTTLADLALEATRLAEDALAALAPSALEDPSRSGWSYPACRAGCHYCCYELVSVTRAEVAAIVEDVGGWSLEELSRLRAELRNAAGRARGLDGEAYLRARIRCPLLDGDGLCRIYGVRPLMCRGHNSLEVEACRRVAQGPSKGGRRSGVRGNAYIYGVMDGSFSGLRQVLDEEGPESAATYLVTALAEALDEAAERE